MVRAMYASLATRWNSLADTALIDYARVHGDFGEHCVHTQARSSA